MNTAIEEIKTITNTLQMKHFENVRNEYPQAFERLANALIIVKTQTHEQSAVRVAIRDVQAELENLLNVKQIHGETLLNELASLVDDMTNIMIAQKHTITPHKGGRDSHLPRGRCTEQERGRIDAILADTGLSFSDWVIQQVEQYEANK